VPLATALCKNLPAENTQGWLSRPKPTRVAEPIEEGEGTKVISQIINGLKPFKYRKIFQVAYDT